MQAGWFFVVADDSLDRADHACFATGGDQDFVDQIGD